LRLERMSGLEKIWKLVNNQFSEFNPQSRISGALTQRIEDLL
jgi:hypothetical protein